MGSGLYSALLAHGMVPQDPTLLASGMAPQEAQRVWRRVAGHASEDLTPDISGKACMGDVVDFDTSASMGIFTALAGGFTALPIGVYVNRELGLALLFAICAWAFYFRRQVREVLCCEFLC